MDLNLNKYNNNNLIYIPLIILWKYISVFFFFFLLFVWKTDFKVTKNVSINEEGNSQSLFFIESQGFRVSFLLLYVARLTNKNMHASGIKLINKQAYAKAKQKTGKRGKRQKERMKEMQVHSTAKAVAYLFCPDW